MEMQLSRSATYATGAKGKKVKRVIIAIVAFLTLSLGAGQVYATVNGTTLAELIANLLKISGDAAQGQTTADVSGLNSYYTDQTNSMVDTKTAAAANDIATWQVTEIERAKRELNGYLALKGQELDTEISNSKSPIKQGITDQVNAGVDAVKRLIDAAMSDRIKNK